MLVVFTDRHIETLIKGEELAGLAKKAERLLRVAVSTGAYRPFARYVEWMREHREIFEFVDGVGGYGSGWWLDK